jgi:hypothetical protein
VGIKRLFNIVRDFISYRRYYLKGDTIRLLIILITLDRFNLRDSLYEIEISKEWEEPSLLFKDEIETDYTLIGYISNIVEELEIEEDFIIVNLINDRRRGEEDNINYYIPGPRIS